MKERDKTEEKEEKNTEQQVQDKNNKEHSKAEEAETEVPEGEEAETESDKDADNEDELAVMKDKYLRLYSEFENFRRRTSRERLTLIESANADLLRELLPVLDDFERAISLSEKDEGSLKEGFGLIYQKFKKTLEKSGVREMEVEKGSEFDAEVHEAISQFPADDDSLKGKVIDVVEKGYYLKDNVLRFAKVVVGS